MTHYFDATGDSHIDRVALDQGIDQMVRLLTRAALRVDRRRTAGVVVAGRKPGVAHDVIRLLTSLGDTTADDLFDIAGSHSIPFENGRLHLSQKMSRVNSRQIPLDHLPTRNGCSHRIDDHCFSHA